ncbi:MAG: spiro-SPASM protein, partial [Leptospirales bacterium]
FPNAPLRIAAHAPEHQTALRKLLDEAREISDSGGGLEFPSERVQVLARPGLGLVQCLRDMFAEDPTGNPKAQATRDSGDARGAPESIALCYGWYALLDADVTGAILADHTRYLAHITYSENVPAGFAPDFVSRDFIAALPEPLPPELTNNVPSKSGDLRAFAFKNIDRFDVEIFYLAPDLRQHRLDLTATTERSTRILTAIREARADLPFAELAALLKSHPQIVRPYPSYFEVELSSRFVQEDFRPLTTPPPIDAAPRTAGEHFLSRELLEKLKADLAANALNEDVTVSLGGHGEPCLHPGFVDVVRDFLKLPVVKNVIIETYGVGLDAALLESLFAVPRRERLILIVRLDSLRPARYAELYGADRCADALAFLAACEGALRRAGAEPAPAIYAEMRRLAETEDELAAFMDRFEDPEQPIRPLLQKYNRYIDRLPERRAADLTPLTRDFCWHLARDFYLTVDGRVPICKQDPYGENSATLNFSENTVAEIVARTMPYHAASLRGEHETIPMPCPGCDEWYTFNG